MQKKLIAACMAIAAFAVVIPPTASASPVLTNASGGVVPVGTEVKATAVGNAVLTAGGFNLSCSGGEGSGIVTTNSGTKIAGEMAAGSLKMTGTGAGGECTSGLGNFFMTLNSKLCGETIKGTDEATGTGCGGPITISLGFTNAITCKYEAASMRGSYVTTPNDDQRTFTEQTLKGESTNSAFCPGEGKLDVTLSEAAKTGETMVVS